MVASPDVREHWRQFLDIAGLPARWPAGCLPAYADPAGVAVLRKVNRQLEEPLVPGSVELLTGVDREGSAMPAVPTATLRPLVERWADSLAGHDLRGDLELLLDEGEAQPLPGPRDQLGAAVDVLAEALAENSRLQRAGRLAGEGPRPARPEAAQVEAAGQAGARKVAGRGRQRLTAYVVCVAYCEECTLSFSRSRSWSNPSKRRLPPPRMTGAVEMASSSTYPAASA